MTRKEAMDKVRALLKLAQRGGTPGESAAAASRAQAILDRYEIERSEIDAMTDDEMTSTLHMERGWIDTESRVSPWKYALAAKLARFNGLAPFVGRRGAGISYEASGRRAALDTMRMMYGWLAREILRQSRRECRGLGRAWADSFRYGMVEMVVSRMEQDRALRFERERRAATNERALMRLDGALERTEMSAIAEQWMRKRATIVEKDAKPFEIEPEAHAHGQIIGRRMDLTAGTTKLGGGE